MGEKKGIELPIRKRGQIIKTFYTEKYDVSFGALEDLVSISDKVKDVNGIPAVLDIVRDLLLDVFIDMTKDDVRLASMNDIYTVIGELSTYAFSGLNGGKGN